MPYTNGTQESESEAPQDEQDQETKLITLKKPPLDRQDIEDQNEEIESRFKRRAIQLDDQVKSDLEFELYKLISDWKDSTTSLEAKLKEWNDLFEGVTTITNFPWKGASELHVPIPKIKAREIHSTINRTVLRPVPFLMCRYAGPNELFKTSSSIIKDLEDFIEDKIKNDTNVHQILKEGINPTVRDGTCIIQIPWETEFERTCDYKIYKDLTDFLKDYPTFDDAGLSETKYDDIVTTLSNGGRYEAQFEYDMPIYDGPKGYVVPLIDFVHWPVYVWNISDMICHGKRIWYTDYQIEEMARIGKFQDKEDVGYVLKGGGDTHEESLTTSRDNIEGITRDLQKSYEYECYELCYKKDLDEDGIKEKYLIIFAFGTRKILRIEKYPIRKGKTTYFPTRLIRRDNRFNGVSLMDDIGDLSKEIDTIHRMRINSRTITHVPVFKGKLGAKGSFDPSRDDLRFGPGKVFWMENPDDVKQFDIRPVDLSGSTDEETLLYQIIDLVTGSSSGLSGQSSPLDPRAPARKQAELLRQSTNRIDDYVEELLVTYTAIGQHFLDMYYQYGPDRIKYYVTAENGEMIQNEIDRSALYDPNVKFVVNGTSVFLNPDSEFSRNQEIAAIIGTNPTTAQNPRIQKEMMDRLLKSARVKDETKLLPTPEELATLTNPQGNLPTEQENELIAKEKLAQERIAQRVTEGEKTRAHERELAAADIALNINQQIQGAIAPPAGPSPAEGTLTEGVLNAPPPSGSTGL